jgi:hypothetical protein
MSSAALESLPPTSLQGLLLMFSGLLLMAIGGFCGLCIFIFKGPFVQEMIALVVMVIGGILFFQGVG